MAGEMDRWAPPPGATLVPLSRALADAALLVIELRRMVCDLRSVAEVPERAGSKNGQKTTAGEAECP